MRNKAIILVTVCVAVAILVIVFFEFFVSKTPVQQASIDTTVIDGVSYSTKPTPYGIFTIRFFEFLPNGGMSAHSRMCWLLYFNEPAPPRILAEPSGTLQIAGPPGPFGDVMIDGWLYSQEPTNFRIYLATINYKVLDGNSFRANTSKCTSPRLSTSHLRFVFSLILLSYSSCVMMPLSSSSSTRLFFINP